MISGTVWEKVTRNLSAKLIEIPTVPSNGKEPLWFSVYMESGDVYVDNAKVHKPSTKMSGRRKITQKDFDTVFAYYHRWAAGQTHLRQEVRLLSRNTAYIFALIACFE